MNLSLTGKTAIICGSTQGIGLACAIELASLGARCVLMSRNEEALIEAVQELDTPHLHRFLVADFSKPDEVKTVIDDFIKNNEVHILINNTGGPSAGPIFEAREESFIHAFNQHVICNHILVKAVTPSMKKAGYGRIINIISTSVKIPLKNLGVSNTIRGAVASWSKTMANELGRFGITVNNILPGATDTQRLKNLVQLTAEKTQNSSDAIAKKMQAEIPAGRFGTAAEIANVAAFLASPAAAYVNGVSIPVDGGRTGSI